jgi:hypothetical protein
MVTNLHLHLRPLQQRFDAGARGRAAGRHPGVPHLVHVVHGADVGQPDGGAQELGLVGAGLRQIAVDGRSVRAMRSPPYHIVCPTGREFEYRDNEWICTAGEKTFSVMTSKGWLEGSGYPYGLGKKTKQPLRTGE